MTSKRTNTNTNTTTNTTTDLPDVATYIAGDRSARAKIRVQVDRMMRDRLAAGDLTGAQAAMTRLAEYTSAAGTVTRTEVDWTALVARRLATVSALWDNALDDAMALVPAEHRDGIDVDAVRAMADQAESDDALANAFRSRPLRRSTRQNDVAALITAAFVGQPVGTRLSVADVVRHANQHGSNVGNGAVTARATADVWTGHAGIVPVRSDADGPTGFRNVMVITDDDLGGDE